METNQVFFCESPIKCSLSRLVWMRGGMSFLLMAAWMLLQHNSVRKLSIIFLHPIKSHLALLSYHFYSSYLLKPGQEVVKILSL